MKDIDAYISNFMAMRHRYEGDDGEIESNEGVHCPSCGHFHSAAVGDLFETYAYAEGEHDFVCANCNVDFTVETKIEFTWASKPAEA